METGKPIYLLVVRTNGNRVIISTSTPAKADDMIKYAVANDVMLGEVVSVIETQEDSELYNWVKDASPYIFERKVLKVCRFDSEAVKEGE